MDHQAHQAHQGAAVSGDTLDRIAAEIVDAGLAVHKALGPGLMESTYEHCLGFELGDRGLRIERQVPLPISYRGILLDAAYRLDLLVEEAIVLEIKAVEALSRLHTAQLLTYLKLSGYRLGFLMNFNTDLFKNGVRRIAL